MNAYTSVRTDLGTLAIVHSSRGVARVVLPHSDWHDVEASSFVRAGVRPDPDPPTAIADLARHLQAHVAGEPQDFSGVALDTNGSPPFLLRVQRIAQTIPPGQPTTYGELALRAGSARAARAVGRAMATNPWPIVVPCHRVFGSGGGFGDYSAGSGLHTKLRLLWREGYRGRTSNVAFDEHAAVTHLRKADARLADWIDRAGPFTLQATAPRPRGGIPPFAVLAHAIISQQLSGKAAATIYDRVAALLGGDIDDPAAVLGLPKAKLRAAGLSENKTLALRDLAEHAQAGNLPSRAEMETMSDEQVITALSDIRGIGRWSAQMLLMFYLGRPNVLPVADLGVQKGFAIVRGRKGLASATAIERAARAWQPYASVACWYLWRAVDIARYAD